MRHVTPLRVVAFVIGAIGGAALLFGPELGFVQSPGPSFVLYGLAAVFLGIGLIGLTAHLLFRGKGFWYQPIDQPDGTAPIERKVTVAKLGTHIGLLLVNLVILLWIGVIGFSVYTISMAKLHGVFTTFGLLSFICLTAIAGRLIKKYFPTESLLPYGIVSIVVAALVIYIVELLSKQLGS